MANHNSHYQTLIVGAGLSGMLIAVKLAQQGEQVVLIEELDQLGAEDRPHSSTFAAIDRGPRLIPSTGEGELALSFLRQLIVELSWRDEEVSCLSHEGSQVKPFVGFGDQAGPFAEILSPYMSLRQLVPNLRPHQWISRLQAQQEALHERITVLRKSFLTKIQHEGKRIQSVEINGKEQLSAERFIYCGNPKDVLAWPLATRLPARTRQKLSRAEFFSSVSLTLFHPQELGEAGPLHIMGVDSKSDESPVIGQFFAPSADGEGQYQLSQWMTLVPPDQSEDSEITGGAIRRMKKLIKKSFPQAFENLRGEILFVGPSNHGHLELPGGEDGCLAPFENLRLAGAQLYHKLPLLGSLLAAEGSNG